MKYSFNEKMYKSPKKDFKEFFDYVLSNKNAKKSYFLCGDLRIPHDTIWHDENGHKLTYREWENYLENRFNVIDECKGYVKRYDGTPIIHLVDVLGTLYIAIIEYFEKANPIIATLFTDHENSIMSFFNDKKEFAKARQKTSATTEGMLLRQNSNNIITDNLEKFNTTIKNYKLEYMKEDLTFFKDDEERNKDGSRTKNPNRVFAAKKAHKTHGFSYKQANNHRGDKLMDNKKQDRASLVAEALEKYINEAELDQDNAVNLYGLINFNNTTGGIQVQFDEENYSNVDITLVAQDQEGVGAYQIESENNDKSQASTIFNALMTDLKVLADNFDRDFESVLKKNGVVRRIQ